MNHLIRDALRTPKAKFAYISPTYKQSKQIAWDYLKEYSRPIPDIKINESELRIDYPNGSRITLYGADNPDSLRGIALWGVVFDEYSQQPSNIFTEIIRPALADHKGYAIWIGCVVGETKIISSDGVKNIIDFKKSNEKYSDINVNLLGSKWDKADGFFNNGKVKTIKITTNKGFILEGSKIHKVLSEGEWKKLEDFKIDDKVDIAHSMEVWGSGEILKGFEFKNSRHANNRKHDNDIPKKINNDFAYFLGLWMAEGSVEKDIHRFTITCGDAVDIEKFGFWKVRKDQWRINSQKLHKVMEFIGMPLTTAPNKYIPNSLWQMTREQVQHFIGGYFDGDGHTKHNQKELVFTSSSRKLLADFQLLCSNFGAIGRITKHLTPATKRVLKKCIGYRLSFSGQDYERVIEFMKPRIKRKKEKIENLKKNLKRYNSYKQERGRYFEDKIVKIEEGYAETFDFTIPQTHTYWSNGFISHNTPKGKNDFYRLYEKAVKDDSWLALKLTVEDTKEIPESELLDARKGMTEDEFQQEFYCSFESSIKGAYYSEQISKARKEGRITKIPYDQSLPVSTWWDLGIGDATAIGFFQNIGMEWRMIDYLEAQGEGLQYYIQRLKEKDYIYKDHWFPHDVQVRELGTGKSRQETLEQLGVNVNVVPKQAIDDGIHAVRTRFNTLWIDDEKCAYFLDAISQYTKEWDDKRGIFKPKPLHDWTSHAGDCLRYWAVTEDPTRVTYKSNYLD